MCAPLVLVLSGSVLARAQEDERGTSEQELCQQQVEATAWKAGKLRSPGRRSDQCMKIKLDQFFIETGGKLSVYEHCSERMFLFIGVDTIATLLSMYSNFMQLGGQYGSLFG
jgi:hypothetical protein